jgi:hypothetical protein
MHDSREEHQLPEWKEQRKNAVGARRLPDRSVFKDTLKK